MGWSDEATIGWNAGGELYANHPLSGLPAANYIACVHQTQGSDLNNIIYDLVPGDLFPGQATPPPLNSTGKLFLLLKSQNVSRNVGMADREKQPKQDWDDICLPYSIIVV